MGLVDYCKVETDASWASKVIYIGASLDGNDKGKVVRLEDVDQKPPSSRSITALFEKGYPNTFPEMICAMVMPVIDGETRMCMLAYKKDNDYERLNAAARYTLVQVFKFSQTFTPVELVFEPTRVRLTFNMTSPLLLEKATLYFKISPEFITAWEKTEAVPVRYAICMFSQDVRITTIEEDVPDTVETEAIAETPVEETIEPPETHAVVELAYEPVSAFPVAMQQLYQYSLQELTLLQDALSRRIVECRAKEAITEARKYPSSGNWMIVQQTDMLENFVSNPNVSLDAIETLTNLVIALTAVQHD